MSESQAIYVTTAAKEVRHIVFRDLVQSVVSAWARSGYPWTEIVDGFGDGSGGTGMPPEEMFSELAMDVVATVLKGQPEAQMRRLMRSRLYQQNYDFDRHYNFTHGNEDCTGRTELLALAVWNYLNGEMERQYKEPDTSEEEEEDGLPEQLALSL